MRKLSVGVVVGAMVLGMIKIVNAGIGEIVTYPMYYDLRDGSESAPFVVYISISGFSGSYARMKVTVEGGSHLDIWDGSGWKSAGTYANCPEVELTDGSWSGWIYVRGDECTGTTLDLAVKEVSTGNTFPSLDEKSITPLNIVNNGALVYATAASATLGKAVLAFNASGDIIGTYAIEDNGVIEGYTTTSGYFKMAVPANTSIPELQARNADNSVFNTQESTQWTSGDPGTETDLDAMEDVSLPVTLTSFTALAGDGQVTLRWVTESEVNNLGFNIYRARREKKKDERGEPKDDEYVKINPGLIPGAGTSTVRHSYCFTDKNVDNEITYFYRLEDVSLDGKSTFHWPVEVVPRAEQKEQGEELPRQPRLEQNFPNPFNPETSIRFAVPLLQGEPAVFLEIYNLSGQKVRTLLQQSINPGLYQLVWDSRDQNGAQVASGVYLCVLKVGGGLIDTRKMALIR